jgi:hypothetical protein
VMTFHIHLKETVDNTRMFHTLLKCQALSYHLRRRLDAKDSDLPDNDLIELVFRGIDSEFISKRTICVQKDYMRQPRGLNT